MQQKCELGTRLTYFWHKNEKIISLKFIFVFEPLRFRHTCHAISKFTSQIKLIQSVVGSVASHRALGFHCQGPGCQDPMSQGPKSQGHRSQVPGSQVLILDYANSNSLIFFFIRVIYVDKTVDNRPPQKIEKEKSVYSG